MVPVALVDGDHLDADVAAHDPRHLGHRAAQVVVGVRGTVLRCLRGVLDRLELLDGPERRPHRLAHGGAVGVPEPVQGAHPTAVRVPLVVAGDRHRVDVARADHRLRAVQRRRRDAAGEVERLQRRVVGVEADQPVQPAGPGVRASGWSPRSPPSRRSGTGWRPADRSRGRRPACPSFQSGSNGDSRGCRPNMPSVHEQLRLRDADPRAGLGIDGVAVRHHEGEPVGRASQGEHDQDGAGRCRGRGGGGPDHGRAEDGRGAGERDGAGEEAPPGQAGELGAAGVCHRGHRR